MHSLIPHYHHDDLSLEEHELEHRSADDFLDYLELLFHIDMGEGHLENFQSADSNHLDIQFQLDSKPISKVEIVYISTFNSEANPLTKIFYSDFRIPIPPNKFSFSLRGPPSIS